MRSCGRAESARLWLALNIDPELFHVNNPRTTLIEITKSQRAKRAETAGLPDTHGGRGSEKVQPSNSSSWRRLMRGHRLVASSSLMPNTVASVSA